MLSISHENGQFIGLPV
jgi:hypothetical protein